MNDELKNAVEVICKALREDKSEGSYYYSWQANISMAFKDVCDRDGCIDKSNIPFSKIHEMANTAAKNFLDLLIKKPMDNESRT